MYAIHTGEYSNQGWGPVFSTVERAVAYKKKHSKNYPEMFIEIEIHVLDDENDTGPVYPNWRLVFDREGNVLFSDSFAPRPYEPILHGRLVEVVERSPTHRVQDNFWWLLRGDKELDSKAHLLVSEVYAPDLDHAVKIAADARRQFLVEKGLGWHKQQKESRT